MTALLKVNLGTPPTGVDGDTSRDANSKANSNVDVLNTQATLTSSPAVITVAQALTAAAHIGKRVNISLAAAGIINLPAASTCLADQVTLLRNIGTSIVTLAIATGSGDTLALSRLNPGETALLDTDGVHAWSVLVRGRANSDNEVVNGNCAVGGNETVGGTLAVTGAASFGSTGQVTISAAGAYSGVGAGYSGDVTVGGKLGVTGAAAFTVRPTFNSNTPWDSGNLPKPMINGVNPTTQGLSVSSGLPPGIASIFSAGQTGNVALTINNGGNNAASCVIGFNRSASWGGFFGLDTDNYWKVGGWSAGANAYKILHEGVDGINMGAGWLIVGGNRTTSYGAYGALSTGGASTQPAAGPFGVSVYAPNGRIAALEFDAMSDRRLKTHIQPVDDVRALDFVRYAGAYTFNWKSNPDGKRCFGYMAQDLGKLGFHELLSQTECAGLEESVDADGWVSPAGHRFSVNYDQVGPLHTSVLRQLLARVEALEKQIANYERHSAA
jgi:hypothetical protein